MGFFKCENSQKGPACRQAGQILLIVILAAVVSLTVGLSAVSRTITNTRVTTEEANSQKALSAAEAGIEELVSSRSTTGRSIPKTNLSNNSSFEAGLTPIRSNEVLLNGGSQVLKDDGADIWLSTYPGFTAPLWSGTLTIYYSDNDGCSVSGGQTVNPAIEAVVISGNRANPTMTRLAYDACAGRNNNFPSPPGGGGTTPGGFAYNHNFQITIPFAAPGFIARIIPLYANTRLAVRSGANPLPSQGNNIDSVGTSGNTTRKIKVFQGWPRIPIEFFPYNIFLP